MVSFTNSLETVLTTTLTPLALSLYSPDEMTYVDPTPENISET